MSVAWRAEWIAFEDDDLIVVDKPAGMPCMSPRQNEPCDVPHRLTQFLHRRGDAELSLGVHQRLDQGTSGLLAYAKSARGNRLLSESLERRTLRKQYVALVSAKVRPGELRHRHRSSRGRALVEPVRGKLKAPWKLAHSTVLERTKTSAGWLVSLQLHTGRKHQLRAQLAAEGAPILGDSLYGGDAASRLYLHAASLELPGMFSLRSELPADFECANELYSELGTQAALRAALERRWFFEHRRRSQPASNNAYRLVNAEADGLPGLVVDVYGEELVAHLYTDALPYEDRIVEALKKLPFSRAWIKRRPKHTGEISDEDRAFRAPAQPIFEDEQAGPRTESIVQSGVRYPVELGGSMSTGIFLDMRPAREEVFARANGKRVLNLFSYTGAFSLAAAAGGAIEIATVDLSGVALEVAKKALDPNAKPQAWKGSPGEHEIWKHDCFDALRILAKKERLFDLVIADPPTHSRGKRKKRWRSSPEDWATLAAACAKRVAPGGAMLMCSNDARLSLSDFRDAVLEGATRAGFVSPKARAVSLPSDCPTLGESPLKRVWVE